MTVKLATSFAGFFFLASCGLSSAATLVNGSFEDTGGTYVNVAGSDLMSNVAAPGWSVSTNSPDWVLAAGGSGALWSTDWGSHFAMGASAGTYREGVSQTITGMTVGVNYQITFQQANGMIFDQGSFLGLGNAGGWEVLLDGAPLISSTSTNDNTTLPPGVPGEWQETQISFVATAPSQVFEFLAFDASGGGPTFQFLDNVEVTQIQIPEPSSALLIVVSGIGLLARRRFFQTGS